MESGALSLRYVSDNDIHRAAAWRISVSNGYLPCGKVFSFSVCHRSAKFDPFGINLCSVLSRNSHEGMWARGRAGSNGRKQTV